MVLKNLLVHKLVLEWREEEIHLSDSEGYRLTEHSALMLLLSVKISQEPYWHN